MERAVTFKEAEVPTWKRRVGSFEDICIYLHLQARKK